MLKMFLVVALIAAIDPRFCATTGTGPNPNSIDKRCLPDELWQYIPAKKAFGCKWQRP